MKQVRVTMTPDRDAEPAIFTYLARSSAVEEARVVDWNVAAPDAKTFLYEVDGDASGLPAAVADTPGIDSVTLSAGDGTTTFALVEGSEGTIPLFGAAAEAIARAGLVVIMPMVYRDGTIHGHGVGEPAALQAALDEMPDGMAVRIDEIGQCPCARADPATTLSERQREAIEVALELGYYDQPRAATHADVAAVLDCAPNTASEHLQKAEAKLVRAGMNGR